MTYRMGNRVISVMRVRPCKNKGLFIGDGNRLWKVASFNSDICANEFEKYLENFFGMKGEKGNETT